MAIQTFRRVRAPTGVAFPVHELVFVRAWAEARGLAMRVVLDQRLNGAEFEEMLVLRSRSTSRHLVTLWRLDSAVVTQQAGAPPRVFGGIHSALTQLAASAPARPVRAPSVWRRMLGRHAR